jgi:hypothetical protein
MKKFLAIVGAVGVLSGTVGATAGVFNPKIGLIVTGIGGTAALVGKSVLELKQQIDALGQNKK